MSTSQTLERVNAVDQGTPTFAGRTKASTWSPSRLIAPAAGPDLADLLGSIPGISHGWKPRGHPGAGLAAGDGGGWFDRSRPGWGN